MDKKYTAFGALAGLAIAGTVVGSVSAQTAAEATGLSEEQAIEIALMEIAGEVQEVELEKEGEIMVYEIEILDSNGQEFEVEIAADTGTVIEVEAEDEDDDDDDDDDHDEKDDA